MKKLSMLGLALAVLCVAGPVMASDEDGVATKPGPGHSTKTRLGTGSLTTIFVSDNQFAGNTFDLENIGTQPITISSFEINLTNNAAGPETVSFYWAPGTSVGIENTPAAWTLMGTDAAVVAAGQDLPTPVAVGGLVINPGESYGIYMDLASYDASDAIRYTNGGPTVFMNTELQLTTNTGQAAPAWSGSFFPRQWNGTVIYDVVPVELQSFDVE